MVKLRVTRVVVMAGRIARERADSFLDGELFALGLAYNSSCAQETKSSNAVVYNYDSTSVRRLFDEPSTVYQKVTMVT